MGEGLSAFPRRREGGDAGIRRSGRRTAHGSRYLLVALCGLGCADAGRGGSHPENALRIGLAAPRSGPMATAMVDPIDAVKLAVNEINAAGGVSGRALELVESDTRSTDAGDGAAVEKLIAQGVTLILGLTFNPEARMHAATLAAGALLYQSAVPVVLPVADPDNLLWRDGPPPELKQALLATASGEVSAALAASDPAVAAILCIEECTTAVAEMAHVGIQTVVRQVAGADWLAPQQYDPTAVVQQLLQDVGALTASRWLYWAYANPQLQMKVLLRMADSLPAEDYPVVLLGPEFLGSEEYLQTMPGALVSRSFVHAGELPRFGDAAAQVFDRSYSGAFGRQATALGAQSYTAIYVLALAIAAADSDAPADVAAQIRGVTSGGEPVAAGEFARAISMLDRGGDIVFHSPAGAYEFDVNGDRGAFVVVELGAAPGGAGWLPTRAPFVCRDLEASGTPVCMSAL
jgi:branched-chain amino acid transport system substrate-binding protein